MRIERTGQVKPLTPRFRQFLVERLHGIDLDEVQSPQDTRADYSCLRGLVAIELKSLEEDGSERMNNLTAQLRQRDDWPRYLGSAPMESFIKHLGEPEAVRQQLVDRIGRNIRNHLKTANGQLAAHEATYPRRNLVRLAVFINEDNAIYDPQVLTYFLVRELAARRSDGSLRYDKVDAVLFFTERHAAVVEGLVAFPALTVEGPAMGETPWKSDVTRYLCDSWAASNGKPSLSLRQSGFPPPFATIEPIPSSMKRHEAWELDYRRKPYMRSWSKARLRDHFDEILYVFTLTLHGSPARPPPEVTLLMMQSMSEMMVEMAQRAIPVTEFPQEHERIIAAANRRHATPDILRWLEEQHSRRTQREG